MKPLVVGNWKMNLDFVEAIHLMQQLAVLEKNRASGVCEVVIAPPFVDLRSVSSILDSESMMMTLAAQHVNPNENGAHTGEISISMLKRLSVQWVLVGHSERRLMYGQDDDAVAATVMTALKGGLKPILCCGESLEVREAGNHQDFVTSQLKHALKKCDPSMSDKIIIAYEPIWAIGSGLTASPEQVREMIACIRSELLEQNFREVRVLYGGSVSPDSAESLIRDGGADGFLVGGASLKAESFSLIVSVVENCYA